MSSFNGYELSRSWFDFCFENPEKVRPIHSAIFFFAIEHCNRLGWKEKFGFPSQMVMEAIGVKNWRTYSGALNELVDFGFIKMIEISKNQYSSNVIAIVKNTNASTKALDKALQKHGTKHSQSTVSIDKQYNKEQLNNKLAEDCLQNIRHLFDPELIDDASWIKTISDLNRIDKVSYDEIIDLCMKARNDLFWKQNFISIKKLRKKNNEGVPYFRVFRAKFATAPPPEKPKKTPRQDDFFNYDDYVSACEKLELTPEPYRP